MRIVLALAIVMASARPTQATDWNGLANEIQGGAFLHYELTGLHGLDAGSPPATMTLPRFQDLTLAGVRLHGFVSRHRLGWHIGLDVAGGATTRIAGFAYDIDLLPIGVAMRWGDSQMLGIGAGVGAMGAVGTLDDAATFPIEAFAEVALGGRLRVLARARATYIAGAKPRHDGSPTFGFTDEAEAMLGVRVGHRYHDFGFPSGNGYFVGASYRELLGTKFVGLVIGYSIDLATKTRRDRNYGDSGYDE